MACFEVMLWSMFMLKSVSRFNGVKDGKKLFSSPPNPPPDLFGAGMYFNKVNDTWLKQLVGILLPGHCVPGLPGPLAGTEQPAGIKAGLLAHARGTKIGTGFPLLGLTRLLKSPPTSAVVGIMIGPWALAWRYRS